MGHDLEVRSSWKNTSPHIEIKGSSSMHTTWLMLMHRTKTTPQARETPTKHLFTLNSLNCPLPLCSTWGYDQWAFQEFRLPLQLSSPPVQWMSLTGITKMSPPDENNTGHTAWKKVNILDIKMNENMTICWNCPRFICHICNKRWVFQ